MAQRLARALAPLLILGASQAVALDPAFADDRLALAQVQMQSGIARRNDDIGSIASREFRTESTPEAAAEAREQGASVLRRVAQAHGAGDVVVRTLSVDTNLIMNFGGQDISASQSVSYALPDKVRTDVAMPVGEQTAIVNGDRGIASLAGQRQPIPEPMVAQILDQMRRTLWFVLGNVDHPELSVSVAGTETIHGLPCQVLAVDFLGTRSRLYVDAEDRVALQAYSGRHPATRAPSEVKLRFSDYREIEGRRVPHTTVRYDDDEESVRVRVGSIRFNPEFDTKSFALEDQ